MEGRLKQATVSRAASGKYFVSLLFAPELRRGEGKLTPGLKAKGLDGSLANFYVDDEGNSPAYETLYRKEAKKLGRSQRRLCRKQQGSHNRAQARHQVAKLHERIVNKRKDFTHKLSTKLVAENDVIVVGNLSLKAMTQGLKLGKSVHDLGYGLFLPQLQYQALCGNKVILEADKWFSSSQTCYNGVLDKGLSWSERVFACPSCGFKMDRDHHAALNLKNYGLTQLGLGRPDTKPVEFKLQVWRGR